MSTAVTAAKPAAKLKKAPARRFWVYILMILSWGQIWVGNQLVANYGIQIMGDLGISNGTLSLVSQGVTIALALCALISGAVGLKLGGKKTLMLGLVINAISGVLYFFNPQNTVFLIVIRLLEGAGAGFINAYSVSIIGGWFPRNQRGLAVGLQMGLYGVVVSSTAIFMMGFDAANLAWWQGCGVFVTAAPLICCVLVALTYKDLQSMYGVSIIDDAIEGGNSDAQEEAGSSENGLADMHKPTNYAELRRCAPFWLVTIAIACQTAGSYGIPYCFPFLLPGWGYSDAQTTAFLAAAFTGTVVAGPLGGIISDRLFHGRRGETMCIAFGLTIVFAIVAMLLGAMSAPLMVLLVVSWIAYGVTHFAIGPMYAVPPEVVAPDFFPSANGIVFMACNVLGVINVLFCGFLADATGGYFAGMVCSIAFAAIGFICSFVMMRKYRA